ncbi:hypothetical protein DERP_005800 [Dermatophagoides pteronyssinus]|uniref:Uncharacterized protein n=1 Tax=Dermatophagoides pteronyssinus TaxID=6956 RepID=A0ABQ8J9Q7_DERPT|nr:hypothetical protein DERP_005800 [Dermatophagoides pteronyssinus]
MGIFIKFYLLTIHLKQTYDHHIIANIGLDCQIEKKRGKKKEKGERSNNRLTISSTVAENEQMIDGQMINQIRKIDNHDYHQYYGYILIELN